MTLDGTHWAYELQRIYSLFLVDGCVDSATS